jgi:hypothetical protein
MVMEQTTILLVVAGALFVLYLMRRRSRLGREED